MNASRTKRNRSYSALVILLLCFVFLPSTRANSAGPVTHLSNAPPDYWPTDGWLTSTPEEQGMNSTVLNGVHTLVYDRGWTLDSIVVIRHGHIVYEMYPNPAYDVNSTHSLASAAKSITSSLIGAALTRGNLSGLDAKVLDFFSDRTIANRDANKEAITIENLLTMTSGIEWDDDVDGDLQALFDPIDFLQYILDKPMLYEPGSHYYYSTADSHLLSAIINQTFDECALEYGMEVLFEPLGISNVEWRPDNQGISIGGGWLNMTPRDFAKIGLLYMNNGTWDDQEIISSSYVQSAISVHNEAPDFVNKYGYQWWIWPGYNTFEASGAGGQKLYVQPENDLIVVMTGPGYSEDLSTYYPHVGNPDTIMTSCVFPAIIGSSYAAPTTPTTATDTTPELPLLIPLAGLAVGVVVVYIVGVLLKRRGA